MKRFLIFCVVSVLSANAPLDSTNDSVDSHIDSTANADLRIDLPADSISPPQKLVAKIQAI